MAFSDYLSIFAVIFSGISLYISWLQYRRDQSHLKVELQLDKNLVSGPAFQLKATNVGRRKINIARIFAWTFEGKKYPITDTPKALEETEYLETSIPLDAFSGCNTHPNYITRFEIIDTTGNHYAVKTNRFKTQLKNLFSNKQSQESRSH